MFRINSIIQREQTPVMFESYIDRSKNCLVKNDNSSDYVISTITRNFLLFKCEHSLGRILKHIIDTPAVDEDAVERARVDENFGLIGQ